MLTICNRTTVKVKYFVSLHLHLQEDKRKFVWHSIELKHIEYAPPVENWKLLGGEFEFRREEEFGVMTPGEGILCKEVNYVIERWKTF